MLQASAISAVVAATLSPPVRTLSHFFLLLHFFVALFDRGENYFIKSLVLAPIFVVAAWSREKWCLAIFFVLTDLIYAIWTFVYIGEYDFTTLGPPVASLVISVLALGSEVWNSDEKDCEPYWWIKGFKKLFKRK